MRRCSVDALVNSVNATWNNTSLDRCITNVFTRLEKVICLINEGDGGNDLVETKRGTKYSDMKFNFDMNLRKIMKDNANETTRLTVTDSLNVSADDNVADDEDMINFQVNM